MQNNDKTRDFNPNVPCPEENESGNTKPHDREGDTLNTQEKTTVISTGKTRSRKKTIYQYSNDVNIQVYNVTQPLPYESISEDSVTKSPDECNERLLQEPFVNVFDMQEYGSTTPTPISFSISRPYICKNKVGYKQIRTNMMYDNRIRFHGSEVCYEGIYMSPGLDEPTDEQFLNNITNLQQISKNSEQRRYVK